MLPRFLIDESAVEDEGAVLVGEQYHHAVRVLRLREGDRIRLFTTAGQEWEGTIAQVGADRVRVALSQELGPELAHPFSLTLAQGLGKGQKMDLVVQKCCELGLAALVPLVTGHSVVRLEGRGAAARRERWRRIARSAAEQSGRRRPVAVEPPATVEQVAAMVSDYDACLLAWEGEAPSLRGVLAELGSPRRLLALVGPEGGWLAGEVEQLTRSGATPVRLGPRLLRTETAGIALCAILMYQFGDLG